MNRSHDRPRRNPELAVTAAATESNAFCLRSGVDIVGIGRIARLIDEFGRSFKDRIYTATEQAYCDERPDPPQHYAARWAAKEAFHKSVATDGPSVPFDAVGVTNTDDGPTLTLAGPAEQALDHTLHQENTTPERARISVSLAHDRPADVAIAHVVIGSRGAGHEKAPEPPVHEGER